jgi:hypothetical protein
MVVEHQDPLPWYSWLFDNENDLFSSSTPFKIVKHALSDSYTNQDHQEKGIMRKSRSSSKRVMIAFGTGQGQQKLDQLMTTSAPI